MKSGFDPIYRVNNKFNNGDDLLEIYKFRDDKYELGLVMAEICGSNRVELSRGQLNAIKKSINQILKFKEEPETPAVLFEEIAK
jgi:hypothetical protein